MDIDSDGDREDRNDGIGDGLRRSRLSGRWAGSVLHLAVTVALLSWLLGRADWRSMIHAFRDILPAFVGWALLFFVSTVAVEIGRLKLVLSAYRLGWVGLMRLHVIGVFFGNFLPGQVGADLYRIFVLRQLDEDVDAPMTLILVLRAIGLAVLLLPVALCLGARGEALAERVGFRRDVAVPALTVGVLVIGVVVLLVLRRRRSAWVPRVARFVGRARAALTAVPERRWAAVVVLSAAALLTRALVVESLVWSVGSSIPFRDAIFVVASAVLISVVPVSFAGWGVREGALTLLLVEMGETYEDALLVAIVSRAFIVSLSAVGGLGLIFGLGPGRASRRDVDPLASRRARRRLQSQDR